MKRIITICLLFLGTFLAIAQEQGNISLNWTNKKALSYGDYSFMVPQFNAENYRFDPYSKTVNYSLTIKLNNKIESTTAICPTSNPILKANKLRPMLWSFASIKRMVLAKPNP